MMEKLKNNIKKIIAFIQKYWWLVSMGAGVLLLIVLRTSTSSPNKNKELLDKSKEVQKVNKEKIQHAEAVIKQATEDNLKIKENQKQTILNKKERDKKANNIFNVGDDNG